jgi:hypothetical protein
MDGPYLKDSSVVSRQSSAVSRQPSAVSRQRRTLLERGHRILINRNRVRRVRQAMVPYLETALGLGRRMASRCCRGWNGRGTINHTLASRQRIQWRRSRQASGAIRPRTPSSVLASGTGTSSPGTNSVPLNVVAPE